ncbi:nickel pincer cofactor biosynthesis protein LarC [Candidatus Clostridium radicumherbarum]|uniref:Pyridinium-3,5-bisthiocarboxylic acid mononucleotide nickel insertion protein n=1 Tax=Candidatus Clostridium radicumherbarum TaxID=3381662 RepID=A0ABW8TN72_9CLOT
MKILYYDCFSGISGDMNLGALIDLGVNKDYIINELSKLNISGYKIEVSIDNRRGITGTRVDVILDIEEEHHHHEHRNLKDVETIIDKSFLSDDVKSLSKKIFLKVAAAEAKIHGKPINEVHFHEVGALDSIVDIVGAAICLDYLKIDKILSSPVELGGGFVKCAHGIFPVPAPATTEILKNVPVKMGAVNFETTTPTGAAILAAAVTEFNDKKEFKIIKIAYGIGHRDTEIPNVLRVYLGEVVAEDILKKEENTSRGKEIEDAVMIECNIDDMNPELYDFTMERLFKAGAMDVFLTPIIMKKGRPGIKLTVLSSEDLEAELTSIILRETTTLGVRKYLVKKTMLKREGSIINTRFGEIRIKTSFLNGEIIKVKPEYEDCKRIAYENNIPIRVVYEEVNNNL